MAAIVATVIIAEIGLCFVGSSKRSGCCHCFVAVEEWAAIVIRIEQKPIHLKLAVTFIIIVVIDQNWQNHLLTKSIVTMEIACSSLQINGCH